MHDQATMLAPDGLRDDRLEHRADDQLRRVARHGRLDRRTGVDDLDRDIVAEVGEGDGDPLAEAVVGRDNQQDPQRPLGPKSGRGDREGVGRCGEAGHAKSPGVTVVNAQDADAPREFQRTR
jgi:hypothetical protein